MAIDTPAKRRSAAGVPFPPLGPGVTPDAAAPLAWRQQAGWGYSGIPAGEAAPPVADAAVPGGAFRRADPNRVFRRSPIVGNAIEYLTRPKRPLEAVAYPFDFSNFPEVRAGSATLSNPSVPAVSGLTIGTPEVTAEVITEGPYTIPSGQGVSVTISGGTANTDYEVYCYVDITRNGRTATRAVKGVVAVR